jgi:hypothetical protein
MVLCTPAFGLNIISGLKFPVLRFIGPVEVKPLLENAGVPVKVGIPEIAPVMVPPFITGDVSVLPAKVCVVPESTTLNQDIDVVPRVSVLLKFVVKTSPPFVVPAFTLTTAPAISADVSASVARVQAPAAAT